VHQIEVVIVTEITTSNVGRDIEKPNGENKTNWGEENL